jgi:hypothetical protein
VFDGRARPTSIVAGAPVGVQCSVERPLCADLPHGGFWPASTSCEMVAIYLPRVAKGYTPVIWGQDARSGAGTGPSRAAP